MAYLRKYNISEANTLTKPLNLQDITITPSKETQTYIHDESLAYNGLGVITVEGVNASIDENIKPENIVEGVSILGVMGTNSGSAGMKKLIERNYTSLGTGDLSGITKIARYTFYEANNLTSITLPEGLTEIGNRAFTNTKITSIDIPETVSTLSNEAFMNCSELKDVIIRCPRIVNANIFSNCPINTLKIYNTTEISRGFSTSIPGNESKNGLYLGNEENPYLAFIQPIGSGCEIMENSLVANESLNLSGLKRVAIPESAIIKSNITGSNTPNDITIYCEPDSRPDSWYQYWNNYGRPVVWGVKKKDYQVDVNGNIQTFNGIFLADKPSINEGEYFWDYYSSNDFSDENIVEIPYYSEESNPKVYAKIELSEKPDGTTFERAIILKLNVNNTFNVSNTNGLCWGKFTPSETREYSFQFSVENPDMCYCLRTEANTLEMIGKFRDGSYTQTAYNYSGYIFAQDSTTSVKRATLTAGQTYYIHYAKWNVYGENPQNTITYSSNLIIK